MSSAAERLEAEAATCRRVVERMGDADPHERDLKRIYQRRAADLAEAAAALRS